MVLSNSEHVQAQLVGELNFFYEITKALRRRDGDSSRGIGGCLRECVDAEFHALTLTSAGD